MFQKYGDREPTAGIGTEPPFNEFEEPATMKAHHTHHPVTITTQATRTSGVTPNSFI